MDKLEKVIAALECCRVNEDEPCKGNCPYDGVPDCVGRVMEDALEVLKEYQRCFVGCGVRQYGMEGKNGND